MSVLDPVRRLGRYAARLTRRGRLILRDGGWLQFLLYMREEVILNSLLALQERTGLILARRLKCPVCWYKSSRFLTHVGAGYIVRNATCPRCGSFPRHRGFAVLLNDYVGGRLKRLPRDGLRLLFAPEYNMKGLLEPHVTGLVGVDLVQINDLVVHREDIMNLRFPDESVDFLSCFHVVEHVPDDERALLELRRVLRPGGVAVLNVPITLGRWDSVSFGSANPLLNDHFFDYGEDFSIKVARSGFSGIGYRLSAVIGPDDFAGMALQDELIYVVERSEIPGRIDDHKGKSLLQPSVD